MSDPKESIVDLTTELAEPIIDRVMNDGVLRDIPILSTMIGVAKLRRSISDSIFVSKMYRFATSLEGISKDETNEFLHKMKKDPELAERVGQTVVLVVDRIDDLGKARLVARVFRAFIRQRVTEQEFRRLCGAIDQGFLDDLLAFAALPNPNADTAGDLVESLMHTGLTARSSTGMMTGGDISYVPVDVTPLGDLFRRVLRD